jgi:hypothetical protein
VQRRRGADAELAGEAVEPGMAGTHVLAAEIEDRFARGEAQGPAAHAVACLDDGDPGPRRGQGPRGREPREAGADHEDVDLVGGMVRASGAHGRS